MNEKKLLTNKLISGRRLTICMTSFSNLSPGHEKFLVMTVPDLMNLIHRFLSLYKKSMGITQKIKK